jgi:hypothetical protein
MTEWSCTFCVISTFERTVVLTTGGGTTGDGTGGGTYGRNTCCTDLSANTFMNPGGAICGMG